MAEEQLAIFEDNPEYQAFVDKFKPKKTTDDCYTPPLVFETVKAWACKEYGIDPERIVRPFYPGGDYERFEYPEGCTVLDNPPFSILTKICEFYLDRGIPFFLFAPSLTAFAGRNVIMRTCHIISDSDIIYENGAVVHTAFITSYGSPVIARTAPELGRLIDRAMTKIKAETKRELPKYTYPWHILTAAMLQKYSKYGIEWEVRREDCMPIGTMDAQRESKKSIFGGGLLLSDKAAAERAAAERTAVERAAAERTAVERAAAERAAAHVWQLSEREKTRVAAMRGGGTSVPKIKTQEAAKTEPLQLDIWNLLE